MALLPAAPAQAQAANLVQPNLVNSAPHTLTWDCTLDGPTIGWGIHFELRHTSVDGVTGPWGEAGGGSAWQCDTIHGPMPVKYEWLEDGSYDLRVWSVAGGALQAIIGEASATVAHADACTIYPDEDCGKTWFPGHFYGKTHMLNPQVIHDGTDRLLWQCSLDAETIGWGVHWQVRRWVGNTPTDWVDIPGSVAWQCDSKFGPLPMSFTTPPGVYEIRAWAHASERLQMVIGTAFTDCLTCEFPVEREPIHYVALGDSYSSGEGVPPYDYNSEENGCHRSRGAYSTLIKTPYHNETLKSLSEQETGVSFDFIACSGAKIEHIVGTEFWKEEAPQLQQGKLTDDTDLVTMSIGGNDSGFAIVLGICLVHPQCQRFGLGEYELDNWVPNNIRNMQPQLSFAYEEIKGLAPEASVVIVGYPQAVPESAWDQTTCFKLRQFLFEQDFLRDTGTLLNQTIGEAAADSGVHFVDPTARFENHEVCSSEGEWIHGLIYDDTKLPPISVESFHPNQAGAVGYADEIESYIRETIGSGSTLNPAGLPSNPVPQPVAAEPSTQNRLDSRITDTSYSIEDDGASTAPLGSLDRVQLTAADPDTSACRPEGVFAREQHVVITGEGLTSSSAARIFVMNNEGIEEEIGTATADASGRVSAEVVLPGSLNIGPEQGILVRGADPTGGERVLFEVLAADESHPLCDDEAPTILIASPADGATFAMGESVTVHYSCDDTQSGIESCVGPYPDGSQLDTDVPGTYSFTVEAVDKAGHVNLETHTYTVARVFTFGGFLPPVDHLPVVNQVKAGQTVPLKWHLADQNGVPVSDPDSFVGIGVASADCNGSATVDVLEWASSNNGLQYLGDGNWRYNWQTPSRFSGSCREVTLKLADGVSTDRAARFIFK